MKITEELAELVGAHVGDGCLCDNGRYKEYALLGDLKEEKDYYENHIVPLFNKIVVKPLIGEEITIKKYVSNNVCGIIVFNKTICDFYNKLGMPYGRKTDIKIPKRFLVDPSLTSSALRGLFDTDGCLSFEKNRTAKEPINKVPVIKLGTVSLDLAKQVFDVLVSMGYSPGWKKPYKGKRDKNLCYVILVRRKRDVINFIERDIGFNNPKHKTKWEFYKKFGYYIPRLTIEQRKKILKQ